MELDGDVHVHNEHIHNKNGFYLDTDMEFCMRARTNGKWQDRKCDGRYYHALCELDGSRPLGELLASCRSHMGQG